jgi:hypothetical protein
MSFCGPALGNGVCVTPPRAGQFVLHACHSGSFLHGHHEADRPSAVSVNTGVTQFCSIPRFVNCLFAQFRKVRVPAYWNPPNAMRSESIGDPSLTCPVSTPL